MVMLYADWKVIWDFLKQLDDTLEDKTKGIPQGVFYFYIKSQGFKDSIYVAKIVKELAKRGLIKMGDYSEIFINREAQVIE